MDHLITIVAKGALAALLCMTCFAMPAYADKRVALVIGNSAYKSVARLDNPGNDAVLMADTLRTLGFTLVGGGAQIDLDKAGIDRAVQNFGNLLQGADVALFYYAGHGVQVRSDNFLVPVDANPTREADVDFQMLNTNLVLRQMESAGTKLNVVLLDACRNNPFGGRSLRAATGGLAQMQTVPGTLISFATQPNSVAHDGSDGHSPYAKALAATLRKPGLDIFRTFNQVGLEVMQATGNAQQPWVSSSPIKDEFYFAGLPNAGAPTAPEPAIKVAKLTKPDETLPARNDPLAESVQLRTLGRNYQYGLGVAKDYNLARQNFEKSIALGDFAAMTNLGYLYETGAGVGKDYAQARQWYEKAAARNEPYALNNLGIYYRDGLGVGRAYTTAMQYFQKSAALGNPEAMRNLGLMYRDGQGIAKDNTQARQWFEKSAAAGNAAAANNVGLMYGAGQGVAQNDAQARLWYEKAAAGGNGAAMNNLGLLYMNGQGVTKDYAQAYQWLQKSTNAKTPSGMTNLGWLYENGLGVPKDLKQALQLYQKAAEAGEPRGMTDLAHMLEAGLGTPKNHALAREWYEKAVAKGDALAMNNLGRLHENGNGVRKDIVQAREWYQKAAALGEARAIKNLQRLGGKS